MEWLRRMPFRPLAETARPPPDRAAWAAARGQADAWSDPGAAADWARPTVGLATVGYGYWLAFLAQDGPIEPAASPAERATPGRVRGYVALLQEHMAPASVATMVAYLHMVLRAMDADRRLDWLRRAADRLAARIVPTRDKRARLVPADRLVTAGLTLVREAAEMPALSARARALRHRDGLMIALLALRPMRLGNLAALALDRHLTVAGSEATVRLAAAEVKTRRPLVFAWPAVLMEPLNDYLAVHRPVLLGGHETAALWAAVAGPLGRAGCRQAIERATARTVGHAVNPHLFGDRAATTVALRAPEEVAVIQTLLGHAGPRTAEKYYNQAGSVEAARTLQGLVAAVRRAPGGCRKSQRLTNLGLCDC